MTFSGVFIKVLKGLNLQKEVGCNRSASLCKLIDKVVQLDEWNFKCLYLVGHDIKYLENGMYS